MKHKIQTITIIRTINSEQYNEEVPLLFNYIINCDKKDTIPDKYLPPNISLEDSHVNFQSSIDGSTLLHLSIEYGKYDILKQLLEIPGINKRAIDFKGNNILIKSILSGRSNSSQYIARKLKKEGIDQRNNEGDSAIFVACRKNKVDVLHKLIKYGGNVNVQNHKGITPLMIACFYMNLEMIQMLLEAGALVNIVDNEKSNCIHYMAKSKNLEHIENFIPYFNLFKTYGKEAEASDSDQKQPLAYALENDCEPMINFLLNITSMKDIRLVYRNEEYKEHKEHQEMKLQSTPRTPTCGLLSPRGISRGMSQGIQYGNNNQKVNTFGFINSNEIEFDELQKRDERDKKWGIMLDEWDKTNKRPKALYERVYKYVPDKLRQRLWEKELYINEQMSNQTSSFYEYVEIEDRGKDDNQIHKDVMRAFQNNVNFMTKFSDGQRILFRVMRAWSIQNELGYVQGMSDLCGLLILILHNEERVFWGFDCIMKHEKYHLCDKFEAGFPGLLQCASIVKRILKKYHSKIYTFLVANEYQFDVIKSYLMEYFMLWFCRVFPPEFEVRIMDIILMEGSDICFTIFSAIIYFGKENLMKQKENIFIDKVLTDPIQLMGENFKPDKFIHFIQKSRISSKEIKQWIDDIE